MKRAGTKMYSFRCYIDEMERLRKVAASQRTTVSELMRVALRKIIAKKK
jgi:hypothetical protein